MIYGREQCMYKGEEDGVKKIYPKIINAQITLIRKDQDKKRKREHLFINQRELRSYYKFDEPKPYM